ncbi:MAG: bifunctional nicotinamidase/pyrazinamidase [Candidatus Bathyarchaeia archaeon]
MKVKLDKSAALIVVDVQKDFCSGGALAVPHGDDVVPILNLYIEKFKAVGSPIFVTRDWHPKDHVSFRSRGGQWPEHCIQDAEGAKFHPDLRLPYNVRVVSKGTNSTREAYSGFEGTSLEDELRSLGISRLFVGGLATDYCVKNTVLDGLKRGFEVFLLEDAVRGVDLRKGDSEKAIEEMVSRGAKRVKTSDIT